ncbi:unnamed protein product [Nesidiocoris tenuis]|uniref:DMAP1-binding domain-containing protein n=1 Tax=Nesidiocoris tenuis TaxID=355587 RepID=A0A6H5H5T6_9HEMI|nr:unnamed protein product [Nesidiocoris tenuis]
MSYVILWHDIRLLSYAISHHVTCHHQNHQIQLTTTLQKKIDFNTNYVLRGKCHKEMSNNNNLPKIRADPPPWITLSITYGLQRMKITKVLLNHPQDGDITQKGYEKKRTRLLAPYIPKQTQVSCKGHKVSLQVANSSCPSKSERDESRPGGLVRPDGCRYFSSRDFVEYPITPAPPRERQQTRPRRTQRRLTHNEKRYHSARPAAQGSASPNTRARRRGNRRLTRNESRYHSVRRLPVE